MSGLWWFTLAVTAVLLILLGPVFYLLAREKNVRPWAAVLLALTSVLVLVAAFAGFGALMGATVPV